MKGNEFLGGFTILMAIYAKDDLELFEKAVDSVYNNSLQPNAFVLVVDGPVTDAAKNRIYALQKKYNYKVLQLDVNVGLANALNAGLKMVKTEWVMRADADDFNLPYRFALQAGALIKEKNELDIIGGAIQEVDKLGNSIAIRRTVTSHEDILKFVAYRNPFNHMTVAFRTEFSLRCGGYPDIYLKEDYALWASMLASGARAINLPEVLVIATAGRDLYRRRGGFRYAIAEISLQRHLIKVGIKSHISAVFSGLSRAFIFLLPPLLRRLFYEKFLRRIR